MKTEQKYTQSDQLQFLLDWDELIKMKRYAGGHDLQMKGLFKGARVVAHWNDGDYQGMVATCVELADGRFAIYNDYYGSCSGCDSWECANDAEVKAMCINLANSAYIFQSLPDVIEFLKSPSEDKDSYSWRSCAANLLSVIESPSQSDNGLIVSNGIIKTE